MWDYQNLRPDHPCWRHRRRVYRAAPSPVSRAPLFQQPPSSVSPGPSPPPASIKHKNANAGETRELKQADGSVVMMESKKLAIVLSFDATEQKKKRKETKINHVE